MSRDNVIFHLDSIMLRHFHVVIGRPTSAGLLADSARAACDACWNVDTGVFDATKALDNPAGLREIAARLLDVASEEYRRGEFRKMANLLNDISNMTIIERVACVSNDFSPPQYAIGHSKGRQKNRSVI